MSENNALTKDDVKKIVKNEVKGLVNKIDKRILNSEAKILGELQKMREDNAAHQFSHMRINDDLGELDKRVTKLEKHSSL